MLSITGPALCLSCLTAFVDETRFACVYLVVDVAHGSNGEQDRANDDYNGSDLLAFRFL